MVPCVWGIRLPPPTHTHLPWFLKTVLICPPRDLRIDTRGGGVRAARCFQRSRRPSYCQRGLKRERERERERDRERHTRFHFPIDLGVSSLRWGHSYLHILALWGSTLIFSLYCFPCEACFVASVIRYGATLIFSLLFHYGMDPNRRCWFRKRGRG